MHAPRDCVHYGGNAFSSENGLLYVAGRDFPIFLMAISVGDTLRPGQFSTAGRRQSAAPATGNVSAYDPATGEFVCGRRSLAVPPPASSPRRAISYSPATPTGRSTRSTEPPGRSFGHLIQGGDPRTADHISNKRRAVRQGTHRGWRDRHVRTTDFLTTRS